MYPELETASNFFVHLLNLHHVSPSQLEVFKMSLIQQLTRRYRDHWFVEHPSRGSAYRCIRINHNMDAIILEAGLMSGLTKQEVRKFLPLEFTMWIDPGEVSYRFGEDGSINMLFEGGRPVAAIEPPPPKVTHVWCNGDNTIKDQLKCINVERLVSVSS